MSTMTIDSPRPSSMPTRFTWTVEEYLRLYELGFFNNRRVELLHG